jgi:hypothetical protein
MRRWGRLRRTHGEKPPSAEEVKSVLSSRASRETTSSVESGSHGTD